MSANKTAVVLDNGSDTIKAGFAKEETPHTVLTSVVGYPESAKFQEVADRDDPFIGKDALHSSCNLDLTFPIKNSIITNWDDMEMVSWTKIWSGRAVAVLVTDCEYFIVALALHVW